MARAGGNKGTYGVSVLNQEGIAVGPVYEFPSVTTVIGETLNKGGAMIGWAQNVTIEGFQHLRSLGYDIAQFEEAQLKALLKEYGFTPYAKRDAAGERGTAAHDVLETALTAGPDEAKKLLETIENEEHRMYASAAYQWVVDVQPEPLMVEVPMVSFRHGFCGTLDLLGRIDGRNVLTDGKTSKRVYDSHVIQLGAYELMVHEHRWHEVDAKAVLRFKDDGTYKFTDVTAPDFKLGYLANPKVFLSLLDSYRELKGEAA